MKKIISFLFFLIIASDICLASISHAEILFPETTSSTEATEEASLEEEEVLIQENHISLHHFHTKLSTYHLPINYQIQPVPLEVITPPPERA